MIIIIIAVPVVRPLNVPDIISTTSSSVVCVQGRSPQLRWGWNEQAVRSLLHLHPQLLELTRYRRYPIRLLETCVRGAHNLHGRVALQREYGDYGEEVGGISKVELPSLQSPTLGLYCDRIPICNDLDSHRLQYLQYR